MQKIILYLHQTDLSQVSFAIVQDNGTLQKTIQTTTLATLCAVATDKEIIIVAPADDVLLLEAKLPKLNRQRLLQALPFALEEQLLTDINDLHFAVADYQINNTYPVAIVAKQKIAAWLASLNDAGLTPISVIPAPLTLPYTEQEWSVAITADRAIVRTGLYSGFSCDKQNLATLLTLHKAEQTEQPRTIQLINTDDQPFLTEKIGLQDIAVEKRLTEKQLFTEAGKWLIQPAINLLQGDYQPKRQSSPSKKIWALASYLAAAWLIVLLIGNIVSYGILHHDATKLDVAINAIYKHQFPHATSVVAPKQRMTEKLNTLMNQNHKNRLFIWLAYIGKSLQQTNTIHIHQADYRNNQLNLDISAPNFESIDRFTQNLTRQGLHVKQQNIATVGTQTKGMLILSEGMES
jgi:general secretion pathway protein L